MGRSVLLLTLLLLSYSYRGDSVSWNRIETMDQIRNRWFAGFAYYNSHLFLFGGEGTASNSSVGGVLGDAHMLMIPPTALSMTAPLSWTALPSGPSPRFGVVSGVVENFWIITHGCNITTCFADTWAMNLDTQAGWVVIVDGSQTTLPRPQARFTYAGGVYPGTNELWLSMGETISGRKLSDTWILEVNINGSSISGVWREVSPGGGFNQYNPFLPHARFLHAGTPISNSTFAIFGGCASGGQVGGPCPLQDSWTLNKATGEWMQINTCAPPSVRSAMIASPGRPGYAYLLGGDTTYTPGVFTQQIVPPNNNDSLLYELETVDGVAIWRGLAVSGSFPARREGASFAIGDGAVYMIGGRLTNGSTFQLDLWVLTESNSSSMVPCAAAEISYVHLHGMFMYLAWGLFLPLGVLMGRYYRWTWPVWFIVHLICQSLGMLLTVAGFVLIFLVGSYSSPNFPHAIVGIVLTFLLIVQFLSGIFHPCVDKENGKSRKQDKSKYRKCWEVYHAVSGFLNIAIGFGQVMLGVLLIGAPLLVWAIWAGLGGLWILVILLHECIYLSCKMCQSKKDDMVI